jgi:F-type H+-transporting ATPase subunit b
MVTRLIRGLSAGFVLLVLMAPAWADETPPSTGQPMHSTGESAKPGEGNINPIPMSWEQIKGELTIWTAAVFVVLLLVLWKFAWGPISQGLDKREKHVADEIAQAQEANHKAKEILAGYEKKLSDAKDEVRAILEKGRHDAEQVGRDMLDKAKADAKVQQERMLKQIDAATSAAIKELADRSAALAVDLAGKIVHAKLNKKDHAQLIEQAVRRFAQGKSGSERARRN